MSPHHCLLFAETKFEKSKEKKNDSGGEDGKIRSQTTFRLETGDDRKVTDRDRSNRIAEISSGNHAPSNTSYRLDSHIPRAQQNNGPSVS